MSKLRTFLAVAFVLGWLGFAGHQLFVAVGSKGAEHPWSSSRVAALEEGMLAACSVIKPIAPCRAKELGGKSRPIASAVLDVSSGSNCTTVETALRNASQRSEPTSHIGFSIGAHWVLFSCEQVRNGDTKLVGMVQAN